jgi:diguanylate cyclase (GGDEF)-like protein/PAS domain S-box-containing protein
MKINFDDFGFLYVFLDENGIILDINAFGCKLIGLPKEDIIGKNVFTNFIPEEDRDNRFLNFKTFLNDTNNTFRKSSYMRFITSEKKEVFLELYSSIAYNDNNEKIGFISFGFDVTEKILYENLINKINEINMLIIKAFSIDENDIFDFFLDEAIKIIDGADAGSILMKKDDGLFHFVAAKNFDFEKIKNVKLTKDMLFPQKEVTIRRYIKNEYGSEKDLEAMKEYGKIEKIKSTLVIPINIDNKLEGSINLDSFKSENAFNENDIKLGEIVSNELSQVIKRKKLEKKLKYMALHDQLTTLPNRAFFIEYSESFINYANRNNIEFAIAYFDLKKFKSINDKYGHDAGDYFLYHFADTLKNSIRNSDFPARIGGDEFVVLFPNITKNTIIEVINRLNDNLSKPFNYNNHLFKIEFNCGISLYPKDSSKLEELITYADKAMYKAKTNDKLYEFYEGV